MSADRQDRSISPRAEELFDEYLRDDRSVSFEQFCEEHSEHAEELRFLDEQRRVAEELLQRLGTAPNEESSRESASQSSHAQLTDELKASFAKYPDEYDVNKIESLGLIYC